MSEGGRGGLHRCWPAQAGRSNQPPNLRPPLPLLSLLLPCCCSVPRQQAAADDVTTDYMGTAVERVQQLRWVGGWVGSATPADCS
jgi:hypothetical protein